MNKENDLIKQKLPIKKNSGNKPDNNIPKEIGGKKGPDPVRYGDWENNGILF